MILRDNRASQDLGEDVVTWYSAHLRDRRYDGLAWVVLLWLTLHEKKL